MKASITWTVNQRLVSASALSYIPDAQIECFWECCDRDHGSEQSRLGFLVSKVGRCNQLPLAPATTRGMAAA